MRRLAMIASLACLILTAGTAGASAQAAGRTEAATELLKMMNLEQIMLAGASAAIHAQVQANALLSPYEDVMLDWVKKYLTWDAVAAKMTQLYADTFTEQELRELTAFYRTPVGQKALATMPDLMQRGSVIGQEVGAAHQAELEAMLAERRRQLEQPAKKP